MATRLPPFHIGDVARADFRTSSVGDAVNGRLQKALGFAFRYQPARLAIGLSLRLEHPPAVPADVLGKPIRGDTLFGQDEADLAIWAGLLVEKIGRTGLTRRDLQEAVAAHWERGIGLLDREFDCCGGGEVAFLERLLSMVPDRRFSPR